MLRANLAYERMIPVRNKWMVSLCLALTLALTGYGSVKTIWVTGRFVNAMQRSPVTEMKGNTQLVLHHSTLGLQGTSGLSGEFQVLSDPETRKIYAEANGEVSSLGLSVPAAAKFYGSLKGNTVDYTLQVKPPELWSRGSFTLSDLFTEKPGELWKLLGQAALTTVLTTVDEPEGSAYCIALELSPEDLMKLLAPERNIDSVSLTPVKLRLLVEIQGKTYLPEEIRVEMTGLSGKALTAIFGGDGKGLDRVSDGEWVLTVTDLGYGPRQLPQIPEEGLQAAERLAELKKFFLDLFP